jgi:hypothetical protein
MSDVNDPPPYSNIAFFHSNKLYLYRRSNQKAARRISSKPEHVYFSSFRTTLFGSRRKWYVSKLRKNDFTIFLATQQPNVIYVSPNVFGPRPVSIICSHCQHQIVTRTRPVSGLLTWLLCLLCIIFGYRFMDKTV